MFKLKHSFNRVEQVNPEPKVPSSAPQKEPEVPGSASTRSEVHRDCYNDPDNGNQYNDGSPLPNLGKDDMLARRTGSYQKPSGNQFKAFLPKPGGVSGKKKPLSGQYQSILKPSGEEKKSTQERYLMERGVHESCGIHLYGKKCTPG